MKVELCTASKQEQTRIFPGDELVTNAMRSVTHAITIRAKPEDIWAWIIQLGSGRAGWYSFDFIDNGGVPSSRRIMPELQHVAVGDIFPAIRGTSDAFIVRQVLPQRAIVLVVPIQTAAEEQNAQTRMMGPLRVAWSLVLEPIEPGKTRLISRGKISDDWLTKAASVPAPTRPLLIERVYGVLAKTPRFSHATDRFSGPLPNGVSDAAWH